MIRTPDQRGQALIETLFAVPIVAIVLGIGFYLIYLVFAQAWMFRSAREAAACLVTKTPALQCRKRLESTLAAGLPFNRANVDEFRTTPAGSSVQISLKGYTGALFFEAEPHRPVHLVAKSRFPRRL